MRRAFAIALALCAVAAFAVTQGGAGESGSPAYKVELDNAFGLVTGGDMKVAGVRAGQITTLDVDRKTKRAIVGFEITKSGFGSLRTDTTCAVRPQSLIGEYFVDCDPGTEREELPEGATIPVEKTTSTVPPDLVNNILRRPERERLRIILNELGYGVGARAEDLNEAIRRASPALRETDRVLRILARQNQVLADLVRDGDTVIGDLAGNREDVGRWVRETANTARISAERREAIAASLQRLPEFLRQLRPTMTELGRVADAQAPTLTDLEASAGQLETLFTQLEPFAESSRVNLRSLAKAAGPGRRAAKALQPTADELKRFTAKTPEVSKNLAIVLKHIDDREASAVEKDPRSPGGQGYTGLEAILQYVFDQAMAINIYDQNGHILKVNLSETECSEFQNKESLLEHMEGDPEFYSRCAAILGPNQPGLNQPDPTRAPTVNRQRRRRGGERQGDRRGGDNRPAVEDADRAPGSSKPPVDLEKTLEDLLGPLELPPLDLGPLGGGRTPLEGLQDKLKTPDQTDPGAADALVDFLFGA